MTLQEKQAEFLLDALDYYTVDTERRCTDQDGVCFYSPVKADRVGKTEGCLIGRKIGTNLQEKLDKIGGLSELEAFELLPNELQDLNKEFLISCQSLHDVFPNWTNRGLSERGQKMLKGIIARNELDLKPFGKYLN